ncbi:MAG: hypothetical protein CVU05_11505, partial [Bacteroidetes bacterium HGW-Bacteroidetes-21]
MKEKESVSDRLDRFIRNHKAAVLGTLVVHAFFLLALVLFEISKPQIPPKEEAIFLDMTDDIVIPENLLPEEMQESQNNEELKNIAANEADKNKSTDDYYKEFQQIIDQSKNKSLFQAENYDDKRWLIKDHSKEFEFKEENQEDKTDKNSQDKQSKNTYAGKTIISYDLGGRKAVKLPVPAYQCMGNGEVIVDIVVNQNGKVISAVIRNYTTPSG